MNLPDMPADVPVFDVANDSALSFAMPVAIPAEKERSRAVLASLGVDGTVSISAACARANLPVDRGWRTDAPEPPEPKLFRPLERHANDNRPQSWPIIEALRRDGLEAWIDTVEHYRGLAMIMEVNPLQGQHVEMGRDASVAHRTSIDRHTGELESKGLRQDNRAPGVATQAKRTQEGDAGEAARHAPVRFSEDTLIAQIDMAPAWRRLRAVAGPLLRPFEDAALENRTLTSIGEARGFSGKQASAAGKALVYEALSAIAGEWSNIRAEMKAAEEQAERTVQAARAAIVARHLAKAA